MVCVMAAGYSITIKSCPINYAECYASQTVGGAPALQLGGVEIGSWFVFYWQAGELLM